MHEDLVFGSLITREDMDKEVAFGDVQISYTGEPFDSILDLITTGAKSIANYGNAPGLDSVSTPTRVDASRLLSAGGEIIAFAQENGAREVRSQTKDLNRHRVQPWDHQRIRYDAAAHSACRAKSGHGGGGQQH